MHLVTELLSKHPNVDTNADSYPSSTLLNKVLEAVLYTQDQTGSMPTQGHGTNPTKPQILLWTQQQDSD